MAFSWIIDVLVSINERIFFSISPEEKEEKKSPIHFFNLIPK